MKKSIVSRVIGALRTQFVAGLLVIIPLALSVVILWFLFTKFDAILAPILENYMGDHYISGFGFIILIFLIWFIGLITKNYFGKQIVGLYETIISKIPIFNSVFGGIKQISDNLLSETSNSFKQVVLVNFPFYGVYVIGFLTSSTDSEIQLQSKTDEVVHVFIPTTPNPTSGFLALVPKKNVQALDITVEEGLKVVISLGVVHPSIYKAKKAVASVTKKKKITKKKPAKKKSAKKNKK